jgi:hypothetical protein
MSVLTAVKLAVDILLAVRLEIPHVDIIPSCINALLEVKFIRLAAIVAEGKACVFTTAHTFDVFGVTVINPYAYDRSIELTILLPESMCKKRISFIVLIVTILLDASFKPLYNTLPAISRIVIRAPGVFTLDK